MRLLSRKRNGWNAFLLHAENTRAGFHLGESLADEQGAEMKRARWQEQSQSGSYPQLTECDTVLSENVTIVTCVSNVAHKKSVTLIISL